VESNLVLVALAAIVAVTVLVVVGLSGLGSDSGDETPPPGTMPGQATTEAGAQTATRGGTSGGQAQGRRARLVLKATRGDSFVQVRSGGVNGRLLWEGTLEEGQIQRFLKSKRLWLDLDDPANLTAELNGRRLRDFPKKPAVVLVTAKGVRTLSTG
jgi:hypothetical protein